MEFDKAIEKYDAFYKSLSRREQKKKADLIYKYIDECKAGKEMVSHPKRAVFLNLGDSINSAYDDYNSLVIHNDSLMYFTSRRPSGKKDKPDKVFYMFDEDIYTSHKKGGIWSKAEYLKDEGFNTKRNEAIVWVSEDGNTRYLYDGYRHNGDILVSYLKNGKWTHPKKIGRGFNTDLSETSISITKDGNTIYFVSNDPRENIGGKDIFFSRKNKKGKWDAPANLGTVINTKYDEEGVCLSPDGKTMYFSSKGHNGMGGYDVFRSEMDANGNWMKPENLGYPINTPDDDLFYRPTDLPKIAYYSARRSDTRGGYDLYKVIYLGAEKKMVLSSEEQLSAYFDKPINEIFSRQSEPLVIAEPAPPQVQPIVQKTDVEFYLRGVVTDIKRKTPVVAKIDLIDLERSQVVATTITSASGRFDIRVPELKNYGMEFRAKDYMFFLDVVTIPPKIAGKEMWHSVALTKIEVGSKIVLKNIYFESGKAILTSASNTELDKLVTFLKENSDIKVEISGHTDNVGTPSLNTKLSGSRAVAVVDYLVAHGIPQEQLISKGYGSDQPMAPNTTAKGRQLNRRVEFKILSKD
jgi:outer membrane protein OmpA-like peptidoglycan-associated protein